METTTETIIEAIRVTCEAKCVEAVEARKVIAERIASGSYRIDSLWGCDWDAVAVGELASEFTGPEAKSASDEQFLEQVRYRATHLTDALMRGYLDGNSTNPVSNGFQSVNRSAARSFLRVLESYLSALDDLA